MTEKPWIKSYPDGMNWEADIPPATVQSILDDSIAKWPDQPAVEFMGKRLTYKELGEYTDRVAAGLQKLGVRPGVHVGLYLPNSPHYVIAIFAILKAGGTAVNYSPLDASGVLEHKIEDSQTDILITLDLGTLYPRIAPMLDRTRLKKLVVGTLSEMAPATDEVRAQIAAAGEPAEVAWDDRHISFADLSDNDGVFTAHPVEDPADAIAVLQYTGGTTGLPKGAMLTHTNLYAACCQYSATTDGNPPVIVLGQERALAVLPPFHIFALTVNFLFGIRCGTEIVQHIRFDPKAALEDIQSKKISVFCGVPTMFTALITQPETPNYDLRSLKFCGSGGAPLPMEVAKRYQEITGAVLSEGWGMTETAPSGTFTPGQQGAMRKAGSCGLPMPGIDIKFLSLENPEEYVPIGERGELCIKGSNVMKGYWKNEKATAETTTFDGYLRTGDVGYMDEDGFVFIVDRTKDMLLCSGYNVYPRVIEEAIYQHPAVEEVAVIGIPDEYRGQSPKAFVKVRDGAPEFSLEELQAFLKDKLGKHEMVRAVGFLPELPKTAVGKISKKDLPRDEPIAARA